MQVRFPIITVTLAAIALAAHVLPGATEALQFDRSAFARGEWWRWVTAHVTHFDANHLGWDVGALLVLGAMVERESRARSLAAVALAALTITPAVWLWAPQFETYRGLSGLDSALFGLLAGNLFQRAERVPRVVGAFALVGFGAKCAFELATGVTVFAAGDSYAPVPLAHLIGLLAGGSAGILPTLSSRPASDRGARLISRLR